MTMQQKFELSDEEFVQAALDSAKCEALVQELSRERISVLKYGLFFTVLLLLMLIFDMAAAFDSKPTSSDSLKVVFVFQICLAGTAFYARDLKIKFLKTLRAQEAAKVHAAEAA